jgi:serine/threonine protein kinase
LTTPDILQFVRQIANALDRAHRSGVVHRDLKTGNIMLTKDGAKLVDFGLAKIRSAPATGDLTMTASLANERTILGTLAYMAPEQFEGKQADARSDIFAFGSVLFEMLTRQKAFSGDSQASLMAAVMNSDPLVNPEFADVVPAAFRQIVGICLAKKPDDRWQSARDIALVFDLVAESPKHLPIQSTKPPNKMWPYVAALIVGGVLAASLFKHPNPKAALLQFEIAAPEKSEFSGFGSAISPDVAMLLLWRLKREKSVYGCARSTREVREYWKTQTKLNSHSGRPTAIRSVFSPAIN